MKILNKKHLKRINELMFTIRTNNDYLNSFVNKDEQTDEEKAFSDYLFWDTRLASMVLYENYGIAYLNKKILEKLISKKEEIISSHDETYNLWQKVQQKIA